MLGRCKALVVERALAGAATRRGAGPALSTELQELDTRLPATATQFLLEKRPELRNTKIGKHILEKHPERHALLTAIDPAAIEHMYVRLWLDPAAEGTQSSERERSSLDGEGRRDRRWYQ